MHALTTKELEIVVHATNVIRRNRLKKAKSGVFSKVVIFKHGQMAPDLELSADLDLSDLIDVLAGLHASGLAVVKRGVLLEFEKFCGVLCQVMKRYRKAGLL